MGHNHDCCCGCGGGNRPPVPVMDCSKLSILSSDNSVIISRLDSCTFDLMVGASGNGNFVLNKQNTPTITFFGNGNSTPLQANVNISPNGGNVLVSAGNGLYVPTPAIVDSVNIGGEIEVFKQRVGNTDQFRTFLAGIGITLTENDNTIEVVNNSPDQVVTLTAGANVTITGTYPNFGISASGGGGGGEVNTTSNVGGGVGIFKQKLGVNFELKSLVAGTGISVTGGTDDITVVNTAPDQIVALTAGTNITITGTYPNFTINSTAVGGGGEFFVGNLF